MASALELNAGFTYLRFQFDTFKMITLKIEMIFYTVSKIFLTLTKKNVSNSLTFDKYNILKAEFR